KESRLRENYGMELAERANKQRMEAEPQDSAPQPREEVEAEIADLRRKLTNIGGVNLDSLAEVEELETRFQSLSAQHVDLSKAKESLAEIINRINGESRRLFSETLETAKGHFQQLFPKLFAAGQPDILL